MDFRVERANIVKVTADAIVLPAHEKLICTSQKGAYGAIFKALGRKSWSRLARTFSKNREKRVAPLEALL